MRSALSEEMLDSESGRIIDRAIKRSDAKKARAVNTKKRKRTPHHKQTHYVANEDVHVENESARQVDAREDIDRDSELPTSWRRPSQLDAPATRPGYVQRWVRYRSGNQEDPDNLDKALEQGWRPVKRSRALRGHELTADLRGKYGQYIVKRGLILMEMPIELADQRNAYYRQKLRQMTEAIDRDLFKLNHPAMPLLKPERKTLTTTKARRGRLEDLIPEDDRDE
mgnify:FL=1